jgi:hypothetical protein
MSTDGLLRTAVCAAIPLWVMELSRVPLAKLRARAPDLGQIIAEKGDVIQFRGKKPGETAKAFNALAEAVAILSFMPGGVSFLGDHYENIHPEGE